MADSRAPATESGGRIGGRGVLVVVIGLLFPMLLGALDQTVVSTAMWTITKELDAANGFATMSWVMTAYVLAATVTMPLYGKFSDQFGRKRVYLFCVTVFLIGSLLCGLAQTMGQLIATRAIQGAGTGGILSLTIAIIADLIPPRERGKWQGLFVGLMMLADVLGPLVGGFFTEGHHFLGTTVTWRWAFYLNVPLGILAIIVVSTVLRLPAERHHRHRIDFLGAGLLVLGTCAVLLVSEWAGSSYSWSSAPILGLLIGGIVLLALFFGYERRAAEPIIAPKLFRNPVFTVSNLIGFLVGFGLFGSIVYIALFLQLARGMTPTQAGLNLVPMTFGTTVAAIVSGRLTSKLGRCKPFAVLGTAIAGVGLLLLGLFLRGDMSLVLLGVCTFVLGLGLGTVMQIPILAVQNAVDLEDIGTATATTTFSRSLGQAFGPVVAGAILTGLFTTQLAASGRANPLTNGDISSISSLPTGQQHTVLDAYASSASSLFLIMAAVMGAAFLVSLAMKDLPLRGEDEPQSAERTAVPGDSGSIEA
ncbi:MDR family MFS transporter [Sciscionella marina]|uniref:MDR family MFS transporter n=1 Tax=Sciscionella marina TaxID=508770 RepID=UPI000367DE79|nr:MDR family MFS transporter [Sciscionella marina]